ncbi:aminopeptidase N [Luteibacter sp. Sphag1AF]|nr:M1 family metallopeptidase [Luteibacter sp. Sphag1AF]MBB3228655.1 aminopeptidase N [Luteibacter sp. Sphag1AF]
MTVLIAAGAFSSAIARDVDVLAYRVRIDPDLAARSLTGAETVQVVANITGTAVLELDAGGLTIDSVTSDAGPLVFAREGKQLRVMLPATLHAGQPMDVHLTYHGKPTFGLEFHPETEQLYTIFSTSEWLPSIDAPDARATLDLSVAVPATFDAIGNGRMVSRTPLEHGRVLYRWQQDVPVPGFVYGFAAGRFHGVDQKAPGVSLRFLSRDLGKDQLKQVFGDTADMLAFFGDKAGTPYTGSYQQALVTDTIGQELAGFALMSEAYGQDVLKDPTREDLIAHEAAHQWWGIRVTCESWNDFWLNEGFANFMAAAWAQHRFGDAVYDATVDRWRQRVERLVSEGKDHPLVYTQWVKPTRDDRAVVYQKGAYALHLLRRELGEDAFWKGIRDYTRQFAGKSVTTADFRKSMELSSGRDLSAFFARWVTGKNAHP